MREHGKLVNLFDWFQQFCLVCKLNPDTITTSATSANNKNNNNTATEPPLEGTTTNSSEADREMELLQYPSHLVVQTDLLTFFLYTKYLTK